MGSIPEEAFGEGTHPQKAGGGFERGPELTLSFFGFLSRLCGPGLFIQIPTYEARAACSQSLPV